MNKQTRVSYHTHVKALARIGLLCPTVLQQIPRSNIHRWKIEPEDKYHDFGVMTKDYQILKSFAHDRTAKRVYAAYVRLIAKVLAIAHGLSGFQQEIRLQSNALVGLVTRVKNIIGLKRALRFLNVSVPTYYNWSRQTATECFQSMIGNCNRMFYNQLAKPEVVTLKHMLSDKQFQYWPVSSIALFALRKNMLPLSLNTWYKYMHKLGINRTRPKPRRKKRNISVRAERPHQLWHADITVFITPDQVKHFIYLVVDNFSRKILAWKIAPDVKARHRKETIDKALLTLPYPSEYISLLTDGGPENKALSFTNGTSCIQQQIALVDVHYSNSLIEAHNKLIKYNYLYRMDIADGSQLEKVFPAIADNFNNRPHISLHGLTPNEAEQNASLDRDQLLLYKKKAREERIHHNKTNRCGQCND